MYLDKTPILGLQLIQPDLKEDCRGYFMECYHQEKLAQLGIHNSFVQENQSFSYQNVIRGLHYQLAPYIQAKLIRVVVGEIWDVIVDLRQGSPTFGTWEGILLSAQNKKQLLIPAGYAHGFSVISKQTTIIYKCDNFYYPVSETGIHCLDPHLAINWKLSGSPILSTRDAELPFFEKATMNFKYSLA